MRSNPTLALRGGPSSRSPSSKNLSFIRFSLIHAHTCFRKAGPTEQEAEGEGEKHCPQHLPRTSLCPASLANGTSPCERAACADNWGALMRC